MVPIRQFSNLPKIQPFKDIKRLLVISIIKRMVTKLLFSIIKAIALWQVRHIILLVIKRKLHFLPKVEHIIQVKLHNQSMEHKLFMGHIIKQFEEHMIVEHIKLQEEVVKRIIPMLGDALLEFRLLNIQFFLSIFLMVRIRYIYLDKLMARIRLSLNIFLMGHILCICPSILKECTQFNILQYSNQLSFFPLEHILFLKIKYKNYLWTASYSITVFS